MYTSARPLLRQLKVGVMQCQTATKICPINMQPYGSTSMQAWQLHEYGGVDKLHQSANVPRPHIQGPDDVLVEVHAASLNPIDLMMLSGFGSNTLPKLQKLTAFDWSKQELPKTLGEDFSGIVVDVGKKAQKMFKKGDQVWGVVSPVFTSQGSHAEFVLTSSQCITHKPETLSHVQAASVPYVLCTVISAVSLFANMNQKNLAGKRALVVGASGGIGTFATQMLDLWGVEVTAVTSGESSELVASLGATTLIDYKTHDVFTELGSFKPFHLILDCISSEDANLDRWMGCLYPRQRAHYLRLSSPLLDNNDKYGLLQGVVASTTDLACKVLKYSREDKHYRWAFFSPRPKELRSFASHYDNGSMRAVVDQVFPFHDLPQAFEKLQAGHTRGKLVVQMKDS